MKIKIIFISIAVLVLAAAAAIVVLISRSSTDGSGKIIDPDATDISGGGAGNRPISFVDEHDIEGFVLLAGFTQPDSFIPAESPQLPERSYFRPGGGVFGNASSLTAWDNNYQVLIGASGDKTGVPVMLCSSSLTSGDWTSAQVAGLFNAAGFRLNFSTLGYENIRLTAYQSVSDDFGDASLSEIPYELAFSTSDGVRWTAIHESGVNVSKSNSNTALTYSNFALPGVIDNEHEVLISIYLNSQSNITANGSMSINRISITADELGSSAKDIVLFELSEDSSDASALFSATPEDAFYSATDGLPDSDFRLTGWDRGRPRFIGYTGEEQTPVVFENIMTVRNWTPADGYITDATAFQIQLRTLGYVEIVISADQVSSEGGPDTFKLAYSHDGELWVHIPDSMRSIKQTSDGGFASLTRSYERFLLPDEVSNRETVFLRVYFDGTGTGESTSINNIELWGRAVRSHEGFTAEMLTIQPGTTSTERNITWHDWTRTGSQAMVKYESAQSAVSGFTQAAQTVVAESFDAYLRRTAHTVTITGLNPDTEYIYAVSGDGINFSEPYSFKTSGAERFTFIAISDTHMGDPTVSPYDDDSGNNGKLDDKYRPGVTTKQGWQDALDVMIATVPDVAFLAAMGDMVDRNLMDEEPENELQQHQIKWDNYLVPAHLKSIPIAPVMGNHEARSNISFRIHYNLPNEVILSGNDMLPTASTGVQQENENMANYWFLYNNALFVVLNTGPRPRDANENPAQDAVALGVIAHFDDVLTAAKAAHEGEYDWLFVQTHKSITGIAKHSADFDVERFVKMGLEALFVEHNVDIVFTAHEHSYTRSFPLIANSGQDSFEPDMQRRDLRMNNVSYNFDNTGDSIKQGDGVIIFSLSSISGQKFYAPFAPEYYNNVNYPYLFDGSRGALNMSVPASENVFLSEDIETFGPRIPWSIAYYRQEYKPIFMELEVTANAVKITAYEFAHDINGALLDISIVDSFTVVK